MTFVIASLAAAENARRTDTGGGFYRNNRKILEFGGIENEKIIFAQKRKYEVLCVPV